MAAVTICSDLGAQERKSVTVSIVSPSICHEVMKLKEESEKVGLKLNIQKLRSWHLVPSLRQIDGATVETVLDFILGAPKSLQMVTAAMKLKDVYSFEGTL